MEAVVIEQPSEGNSISHAIQQGNHCLVVATCFAQEHQRSIEITAM